MHYANEKDVGGITY